MSAAARRQTYLTALVGAVALVLALWSTDSADAGAPVISFTNTPVGTQAGGHPNVATTFELGNRFTQPSKPACECNDPKDIITHAPAGVIANPHVISICTSAELATNTCAADSQAGILVTRLLGGYELHGLYRTVPQAGQAALFAFQLPAGSAGYIAVNARTGGDYGLDFVVLGLTHVLPPSFIGNIFWGVPGDPVHDPLRFGPGDRQDLDCVTNPVPSLALDILPEECGQKNPRSSSLPIAPFVQSPTTCVGPLVSTVESIAYDHETDHAAAPWPATTGCDKLSFDPSLAAAPTTTETDSASGLAVDLKVPQFQDPKTPSPSAIRATTVTLPEGFSINSNAADGKLSCSDSQANFGSEDVSGCPEFSKIGTTTLDSSALPAPIHGYVYLGEPKPGDRYRAILTASGFATNVKIAGSVHLDSNTGQIVIALEDLPQAPFQEFDVHLFGSERGLLVTPERCGTYAVKTTFKPWAAELSDQTSTQFFTLDSGPGGSPCPGDSRPFDPTLQAGTANNTAGAYSPFVLRLDRADGDQNLAGLTVKTPPGFIASIKGIPYCPEAAIAQLENAAYSGLAEQASPACPALSRVGSAIAAAGAGSRPVHVSGTVYLAGPYKGAPVSLVVVIPAVSGPYDLGNVVVRAAAQVDPVTARITAISDPLPQILEGIPLRTRMVQVNLDRPGFALNPTNCDPFTIEASIAGDEGAQASRNAHFQAANCADLPFEPKFVLRMTGGLKRHGHPAIRAALSAKPGEAGIGGLSATLPKGQLLDNAHIRSICTRVQFAAGACPGGSRIGRAEATTPLLDAPLTGSVYLRSSSNKLPDLAIDLGGQVDFELSARVDSVNGRLRATAETVPDVPVSEFVLDLDGGSKGLLINSEDLCAKPRKAAVQISGQNGKSLTRKVRLQLACGSKRSRGKAGRAGR